MSEEVEQAVAAVGAYSSEEEKLIRKIEREAERITGERRANFVDSKSLCTSCQRAIITRVSDKNHRLVECSMLGRRMPDNVSECSAYFSATGLSLSQMASIARLIEVRDTNQGYL
jgi:hypothetical protein